MHVETLHLDPDDAEDMGHPVLSITCKLTPAEVQLLNDARAGLGMTEYVRALFGLERQPEHIEEAIAADKADQARIAAGGGS